MFPSVSAAFRALPFHDCEPAAACFRAGTLFIERATAAGTTPLYDYKEAFDDFANAGTDRAANRRMLGLEG